MSQLNVDVIRNRLGTGGPTTPSLGVTGIVTATGVSVTGIVTATSFVGSGANLTNLPASTSYTDLDNMLFG